MKTVFLGAMVTLALGLLHCGAPPVDSCTTTSGSTMSCAEYAGFSGDQESALRSSCASGTFNTAACSHANAVGGCRTMVGGYQVTTWFYSGSGVTADTVRMACPTGTFVAP